MEKKQHIKSEKKKINSIHKDVASAHNEKYIENQNKHKEFVKTTKEAYKSGKLTKEQKRSAINLERSQYYDSQERLESSAVIGHYKVQKLQDMNRATYIGNVYGENSSKYKRAKKYANSTVRTYGNYTVREKSDGTYHITKTEVYLY